MQESQNRSPFDAPDIVDRSILGAILGRRSFLKRSFVAGVGATVATGLLAACGGDDDDAPATTAPGGATSTTSATSMATSALSSPAASASPAATSAATSAATTAATSTATTTSSADITPGGSIVYGTGREPDRLDPTRSSIAPAQLIFFNLYDCLVFRAEDATYEPWLAESWEIAPDGTAYTFELRDGVTFHDGEPFNAEAVKYMMDRVHDPAAQTVISPGAYGFYESTDTPDDLTVVINLSAAWAPLIDAFSFSYRPVSPAAGEEFGEDLGQHPVGTGPFKFQEWVPNSNVTIVKNPDYNWPAPAFQHDGPAYLDEVTFRLIPESAPRVAALENNEVQIIEVLPKQDAERIQNNSDFEVIVGITPGIPYGYGINVRKPPTDELAVRQALNWAIDQDSVASAVFGPLQSLGAFQPSYSVLVPQTFGYEPNADEVYDYDPERAMQILEEAGWTVGDDDIREKNGQRLEVYIATWETLGVEEVIQAQFREVGIDWQIRVNPVVATNEAARREEVHSSPLPAARSDPDILSFFHSRNQGTGFNFIFHSNARLDELLDAGASEPDQDARREIYSEIQMIIMEEAMWLSVHQRDNVSAKSVDVQGDIVWDRGLFPYLYDLHLSDS